MNPFKNAPARMTAKAKEKWEGEALAFVRPIFEKHGVGGTLHVRSHKSAGSRPFMATKVSFPTAPVPVLFAFKQELQANGIPNAMLYEVNDRHGSPVWPVYWPINADAEDVRRG